MIKENIPQMVLVTGATGFCGSHILRRLVEEKYGVVCLKRTSSDCSRVHDIYNECEWVNCDDTPIEEIFKSRRIDVIIHCATFYGRSGKDFLKVWKSNVFFPVELFEMGQRYGCRYFINTDTFFTKQVENLWSNQEKMYMDTYTKTKFAFQNIMKDGIDDGNMSFINMRLEHVYGPNDNPQKFVYFVLDKLRANCEKLELSSGKQLRDWVYISDVVDAYMAVLHNLEKFEKNAFYEYEIGTGTATSLREFVETAKDVLGSDTNLVFGAVPMNTNEILFSCANTDLNTEIGWSASVNIKEGIAKMIGERGEWWQE